MKRLTKFFAVTAALTLLLTAMFAFGASAASVKYSASSASGSTGDTVTINVSASPSNVWGCSLSLKYDASKLQYVSASKGALASGSSLNHSGSAINFVGNLNSDRVGKGGVVFSVKFKIKTTALGSIPVTLTASGGNNNIDSDGNNVPLSTANGSITVKKPAVAVSGISLNTSSVSLKKGDSSQLKATVSPADATNKSVTYSSSNTRVATVNSSGKITAVGGGTATITAKSNNGKAATCRVTVKVSQTGIKVSGSASRTVGLGSTARLSVVKVPADATDNYAVTWSSADTKIATVSSNGTVSGVALGSTTITARSNGWTAAFKITVVEKASETEAPSVPEESSETVPEESTDLTVSQPQTEPSTESTTENAEDKQGFFAGIMAKLNDESNKVSRLYHYGMVIGSVILTAGISIPVTYLVTSGYFKNKSKKPRYQINREDD